MHNIFRRIKNEIFFSPNDESDPFWANAAGDLFTGIALEIFKNSKNNEVSFLDIFYFRISGKDMIDDFKDYVNTLDKKSYSYLSLSIINSSPSDTRASIVSVFKQKMKILAMFDTEK